MSINLDIFFFEKLLNQIFNSLRLFIGRPNNMFFTALQEEVLMKKVLDTYIEYLFLSHFHPDHMGIAGQLAELGIKIVVVDIQKDFVHFSDEIFVKEKNKSFIPIDDAKVILISIDESRSFFEKLGIQGEIIETPGHSDDSVSIWLDDGMLLVGDLNPLYELPLHEGTQIAATWNKLLKMRPNRIGYGHAKTAILEE